MRKRGIITTAIIFIAIILILGASYTSQINKGQLVYWLEFKSPETNIRQLRGYRILGDSGFIDKDYARGFDCIRVYNSSGGTLNRGDVVVWNQTELSLVDTVARSADPETLTIALSGALEKCPLQIYTVTYSLADACTLDIRGINWAGTATAESIIHTATGTKFSVNYWDSLTAVYLYGSDAADSVVVDAYRTQAITTTTSADNILAAGVIHGNIDGTVDSVLNRVWGTMAIFGVYDSVKVLATGADALVGRVVHTSTSAKKGLPDATSVVGAGIGRLLESGNTDGYYKVHLMKE